MGMLVGAIDGDELGREEGVGDGLPVGSDEGIDVG